MYCKFEYRISKPETNPNLKCSNIHSYFLTIIPKLFVSSISSPPNSLRSYCSYASYPIPTNRNKYRSSIASLRMHGYDSLNCIVLNFLFCSFEFVSDFVFRISKFVKSNVHPNRYPSLSTFRFEVKLLSTSSPV
jgi:hypothetical protein